MKTKTLPSTDFSAYSRKSCNESSPLEDTVCIGIVSGFTLGKQNDIADCERAVAGAARVCFVQRFNAQLLGRRKRQEFH